MANDTARGGGNGGGFLDPSRVPANEVENAIPNGVNVEPALARAALASLMEDGGTEG